MILEIRHSIDWLVVRMISWWFDLDRLTDQSSFSWSIDDLINWLIDWLIDWLFLCIVPKEADLYSLRFFFLIEKEYSDEDSEADHRETWENNLDLIEQHNIRQSNGEATFTLGLNALSDLDMVRRRPRIYFPDNQLPFCSKGKYLWKQL